MKRSPKTLLLAATIAALTICENSMLVNAQSIDEMHSREVLEINDSFVELMQTNPELLYEEYEGLIEIQEIPLEDSRWSECVEAYEYNADGILREIECDITLNRIEYQSPSTALYSASGSTSTFYILSATASSTESDDTLTEDGVTLKGYIGWEDILGPVNRFEYVKGSRSGAYSGTATYKAYRGTHLLCSGAFDTSFYATSDESDTTGFTFRLVIDSPTAKGTTIQLYFTT